MEPAVIVPALGLVDTAVRAGGDEAEDVVLGDDGAVGGVAPRAVGAHGIMVGGAGPIVDHRIRQMGLLARGVMAFAKVGAGMVVRVDAAYRAAFVTNYQKWESLSESQQASLSPSGHIYANIHPSTV